MEVFDTRLILRRDALDRGFTDRELARARQSGELQTILRGVYTPMTSLDAAQRHRLAIEAALATTRRGVVVSHTSAAVLHGLAMWRPNLDLVHVWLNSVAGGKRTRTRHVHVGRLASADVTVIDDIAVTSVARTLVDCALLLPFEEAVVLGDSALQQGLVTRTDVEEAMARARGRHGLAAAARAVAFLDGRSESVGESRSRVLIHRAGLPRPQLQHTVYEPGGEFVARVDFFFDQFKTVGEFDGMGKYAADGRDPRAALRAEKAREDALRALGLTVVRWTWHDLDRPEWVIQRLQNAFGLGRRAA
ncbi:hypothetical protein FOS14_04470 [Skermania sp. ID1734]|uniref:hypothetical protein n=1 Tax=Skermania sp. ID1734 TaxID=2597516 RepID=UPI001181772E|nr:hypothetical protein [Skermania sp. ID1734]TSE01021.1 hypothetical protein FOS14_04470 [Skermania sp. ID1734]